MSYLNNSAILCGGYIGYIPVKIDCVELFVAAQYNTRQFLYIICPVQRYKVTVLKTKQSIFAKTTNIFE